jgi:hypothetical protein
MTCFSSIVIRYSGQLLKYARLIRFGRTCAKDQYIGSDSHLLTIRWTIFSGYCSICTSWRNALWFNTGLLGIGVLLVAFPRDETFDEVENYNIRINDRLATRTN